MPPRGFEPRSSPIHKLTHCDCSRLSRELAHRKEKFYPAKLRGLYEYKDRKF